ncbi:MAG: family 78 glycoside hydrolase catalytic domain [Opitutaceae bacterium]|nr:family 78 glycoside hydrolase catalytic domain [Opitutaceae bacterium]
MFLALGLLCAATGTFAALTVDGLRCEDMENPAGIDADQPRLGWRLQSAGRGEAQTAYQVLVAGNAAMLAQDQADYWNSGKVASCQSQHVVYLGRPPASSQQVFWKVRVWDAHGAVSPWSAVASWTMGVLDTARGPGWQPGVSWISDAEMLKWERRAAGFSSRDTDRQDTVKWVQLDLGAPRPIDTVRIYPVMHTVVERHGQPLRFKLELSDDPSFRAAVIAADRTEKDFAPGAFVISLPVGGRVARHIRFTATKLRALDGHGKTRLACRQIEVLSAGENIAPGARVTASDAREDDETWSRAAAVDGLGLPAANPLANATLLLRREFNVRPGLRRAIIHVTGLGQYELTANGGRVGDGLLAPGWTHYAATCLYDTHDITAQLRPGANALGLQLAGGPYNIREGAEGRYAKLITPARAPAALAQLRLEYDNGLFETISTDATWRATTAGPAAYANFYGGEDFDARRARALRGWDQPGFDDSAWPPAATATAPGGKLRGATHGSPPFRAFETFAPAAIRAIRPGVNVYDFGQNASMMPRLRVRGPAGSVVRMIPAELLHADGTVDRRSCGGNAWWQYTLAGPAADADDDAAAQGRARAPGAPNAATATGFGETTLPAATGPADTAASAPAETWFPKFFYQGARYLQVELYATPEDAARAVTLGPRNLGNALHYARLAETQTPATPAAPAPTAVPVPAAAPPAASSAAALAPAAAAHRPSSIVHRPSPASAPPAPAAETTPAAPAPPAAPAAVPAPAAAAPAALPVIESLESIVVHSDSPATGEFECSHALLNRIRTLVRWAQAGNLAHVLTDCPHREKLGWLEQYHLNGPALRYEWDVARLFKKCFGDIADTQLPDGLVPGIAPEYTVFDGGFRDSPEWGGAIVLAAWQHHLWTGDVQLLRRHYPRMQRYADYLATRAEGHLLSHGLGDWYDLGPKRPGVAQLTPVALTATATYHEITATLGRIATLLNRKTEARYYESEAARIADAFNRAFLDPRTGLYATGSQTAQAMPLVLGLVPPARRAAVLAALVADIENRGHAVTAGDIGYRYVLRALADAGRSDVIFAMTSQSEKPGYAWQLARGATSLAEAWDADPRSSQNHFMLGQITEWLYHDLAGIQPDPDGPGFKRVIIKPAALAALDRVRAAVRTPRGPVSVEWRRERGHFALKTAIPPGVVATVRLPVPEASAIREGGFPVAQARGVRLLRREKDGAVFEVASGSYHFTAPE